MGEDNALYIIYAYGNENNTNEIETPAIPLTKFCFIFPSTDVLANLWFLLVSTFFICHCLNQRIS